MLIPQNKHCPWLRNKHTSRFGPKWSKTRGTTLRNHSLGRHHLVKETYHHKCTTRFFLSSQLESCNFWIWLKYFPMVWCIRQALIYSAKINKSKITPFQPCTPLRTCSFSETTSEHPELAWGRVEIVTSERKWCVQWSLACIALCFLAFCRVHLKQDFIWWIPRHQRAAASLQDQVIINLTLTRCLIHWQ